MENQDELLTVTRHRFFNKLNKSTVEFVTKTYTNREISTKKTFYVGGSFLGEINISYKKSVDDCTFSPFYTLLSTSHISFAPSAVLSDVSVSYIKKKVLEAVCDALTTSIRLTNAQLTEVLGDIYAIYQYPIVAKAAHISQYFWETNRTSWIVEGKKVDGYIFSQPKTDLPAHLANEMKLIDQLYASRKGGVV